MIFGCQTNPEIHCSRAIHNVQDKAKNLLHKLVKASWKFNIFYSFMFEFFLITCVFTDMPIFYKHFSLWGRFSSAIMQFILFMASPCLLQGSRKNPTDRRHWIFWPMPIVGPIAFWSWSWSVIFFNLLQFAAWFFNQKKRGCVICLNIFFFHYFN